jgi:hypothetical protein
MSGDDAQRAKILLDSMGLVSRLKFPFFFHSPVSRRVFETKTLENLCLISGVFSKYVIQIRTNKSATRARNTKNVIA